MTTCGQTLQMNNIKGTSYIKIYNIVDYHIKEVFFEVKLTHHSWKQIDHGKHATNVFRLNQNIKLL